MTPIRSTARRMCWSMSISAGRGSSTSIISMLTGSIPWAEFDALGFEEYCRPDSVVLVEWADKVTDAMAGFGCIELRLAHEAENQRTIVIQHAPDYLNID